MQERLLDELWKVHFIDGNVSRSIEALLANEDAGLIRLVCKKAKGVTPSEVRASLKRAKIRIDFPVPAVTSGRRPLSAVGEKRQRARQPMMMGGVTVGNLVDAGLIRAPFRIEREYKAST
jgi:hypothetical protein